MTEKIVHISDLHAKDPRVDFNAYRRSRKICKRIAKQENPETTIVVITGDLGWGMSREEKTLIMRMLYPLKKAKFPVLICKGNHDHGPKGLLRMQANVDRFADIVEAICGHKHRPPEDPHTTEFGPWLFINLNTSWDQTFLSRGHVGDEQYKAIQNIIEETDLDPIIYGHHCPSGGNVGLRLSDRDKAKEYFDGCKLWLSGHLHRSRMWSNTFGTEYLVAAPMTPREQKYQKIWFNDKGVIQWEWN